MATWAVVKAQARDILGIDLTDANVDNVPLLATDAYGNFIKGPNGFPHGRDEGRGRHRRHRPMMSLVEGNPRGSRSDLADRGRHRSRSS